MEYYPLPEDKNGNPIYPGDSAVAIIDGNEQSLSVVGISSPVSVLVIVEAIDENGDTRMHNIFSREIEVESRGVVKVIESAYNAGRKSKKKDKDIDLAQLFIEYDRAVLRAVASRTAELENTNAELLKLLKETGEEIEEIKRSIDG